MSNTNLVTQRARRLARTRAKIFGTAERPRLCVVRSLRYISAQLIDDESGRTVVAVSDRLLPEESNKGTKRERALQVGKILAERAKSQGVSRVVFDRRDKRYHGRVQALAEGAREGGLVF